MTTGVGPAPILIRDPVALASAPRATPAAPADRAGPAKAGRADQGVRVGPDRAALAARAEPTVSRSRARPADIARQGASRVGQSTVTPSARYTSLLKATLRGSALALLASKRLDTYP